MCFLKTQPESIHRCQFSSCVVTIILAILCIISAIVYGFSRKDDPNLSAPYIVMIVSGFLSLSLYLP